MATISQVPDVRTIKECMCCFENWSVNRLPLQFPCECAEALVCKQCIEESERQARSRDRNKAGKIKCPCCGVEFNLDQLKPFHKSFLSLLTDPKPFCEDCNRFLSHGETPESHDCSF